MHHLLRIISLINTVVFRGNLMPISLSSFEEPNLLYMLARRKLLIPNLSTKMTPFLALSRLLGKGKELKKRV
jgi:hypothetical protein